MKTIRIGINGFGRIGRTFTRIALERANIDLVAINTASSNTQTISYLIEYDSMYGRLNKPVSFNATSIMIDNKHIACFNYKDPKDIPWSRLDIDVVIDCTGVFETRSELSKHLNGSVKKVVLTAPTKDKTIPHLVFGVNDDNFDFDKSSIISNASCTTNCAAPMFKIINDALGIKTGFLTTIHSYTSSQQLLDNAGKSLTLSRAAPTSIIPSTTGATDAVVRVIPSLEGKIDGMSIRVPTPTVSFSDISCLVEKSTTIDQINQLFKDAENKNPSIISCESKPLVSSDYIGSTQSCIFDTNYTTVMPENLIKIFGWYDNEWGYSSRLVDLIEKLIEHV